MIHYVFSEETEGFLVVSAVVNFLVKQILGGKGEGKREDSKVSGRKGQGTRVGGISVAG